MYFCGQKFILVRNMCNGIPDPEYSQKHARERSCDSQALEGATFSILSPQSAAPDTK